MRDVQFDLRDFKLPNGLRIVVDVDHSAPVVGVVAVVGAGGSSDPAGKEGLAHLVEHLSFRARPDGKTNLWTLLAYAGAGNVDAATSLDDTLFYEFGPSSTLDGLVKLEGMRLSDPLGNVDPAVFDVEKDVVRNEVHERAEKGVSVQVMSELHAALFPAGHRYDHAVQGSDASLNGLTLADAQAFAKAHYRPDNITLLISGDVDVNRLSSILSMNLPGALSSGTAVAVGPRLPAEQIEPPAPPEGGMRKVRAHVAAPQLFIGWTLPSGYDAKSAVQQFVAESLDAQLLGAYFNDPDIEGFTASLDQGKDASMLIVGVQLRQGDNPERSATHVLDQLVKLYEPGFQETRSVQRNNFTFARMRPSAVMRLAFNAGSLEARSLARAESTHWTGDSSVYSHMLGNLARLEAAQVTDFAYKYVNRSRARVVFVEPLRKGDEAPVGGVAHEAFEDPAQVSFPTASIKGLMHPPGFNAIEQFTLPNGLEVLVERRNTPLVTLTLAMRGGEPFEPVPGAAAMAQLTGRQLDHISGNPGDFGASIRARLATDTLWLTERAASGNLVNALAVLSDRVTSMRANEAGFAFVHDQLMPTLQREENLPSSRAHVALQRALFGDSSYGHSATTHDLTRVNVSDAQQVLDATYDPHHAVLAIVGEIPPDVKDLRQEVWTWFKRWGALSSGGDTVNATDLAKVVAPVDTTAVPTAQTTVVVEPREQAGLTDLTFACALPAGNAKSSISDALLAELFASRINQLAREERGGTYGVRGNTAQLRGATRLEVTASIDNAHLRPTLSEIKAEWQKLLEEGPSEAMLSRAKWDYARQFNVDLVTNDQLARAAVTQRVHGLPLDAVDLTPQLLSIVTRADLRNAARACQAKSALSLVGDAGTVQSAVAGTWK